MDKIAVLIPCYNEEKTIAKVVKDCLEEVKSYGGMITIQQIKLQI